MGQWLMHRTPDQGSGFKLWPGDCMIVLLGKTLSCIIGVIPFNKNNILEEKLLVTPNRERCKYASLSQKTKKYYITSHNQIFLHFSENLRNK